jgi:hypothetical protein
MKIQVPVLGGLRKKVSISSGTSIAGYDSLTLAQLASLLGVVQAPKTLPNTISQSGVASLNVGPGLTGGGPLIGNVALGLALGTLPAGSQLYDSDAEDYGMMLSLPGPQGLRGLQGFSIPGLDGIDGEDGFPGIPGAAGATGPQGPAGPAGSGSGGPVPWTYNDFELDDPLHVQGLPGNPGATGLQGVAGPPGPALWFEADQGEDSIQLQGAIGNPGAAGATGPAGAPGPALWYEADAGEDAIQLQGIAGNIGPAGAAGAIGPVANQELDDEDWSFLNRDISGSGDGNVWTGVNNFLNLLVNGQPIPTAMYPQSLDADMGEDPWMPRSESSGLQMGSDFGFFTGTLTGCTTSPTGTFKWFRVGPFVVLAVPSITGVSNTTTMTVTGLPANLQPATTAGYTFCACENNTLDVVVFLIITNGSGTLTFYNSIPGGPWTASGTKGVLESYVMYLLL